MPFQGDRVARDEEKNNFKEGRSGSKCKIHDGPAARMLSGNPTKGGGINRSTNGTAQENN